MNAIATTAARMILRISVSPPDAMCCQLYPDASCCSSPIWSDYCEMKSSHGYCAGSTQHSPAAARYGPAGTAPSITSRLAGAFIRPLVRPVPARSAPLTITLAVGSSRLIALRTIRDLAPEAFPHNYGEGDVSVMRAAYGECPRRII